MAHRLCISSLGNTGDTSGERPTTAKVGCLSDGENTQRYNRKAILFEPTSWMVTSSGGKLKLISFGRSICNTDKL